MYITYIHICTYVHCNNFSDHIIYSLQFCFMRGEPQSSGDKRLLTVKQIDKVQTDQVVLKLVWSLHMYIYIHICI